MNILSYSTSHNCSAALMCEGEVVGFIQEERFSKRKNQTGYPKHAIDALINQHLGGDVGKLDDIVAAGNIENPIWIALDHYSDFDVQDWLHEMREYWYPYFYGDRESVENYFLDLFRSGKKLNKGHNFNFEFMNNIPVEECQKHFIENERVNVVRRHLDWSKKISSIEHHTCHAYYALYGGGLTTSQRKRALVFTADASGDGCNWSVSTVDQSGELNRLDAGDRNTIARIYKFVTLILGMKPNEHEYKVMGLSGYSNSASHIQAVENILFNVLDFKNGSFVSSAPLVDSYFDLKNRLEGHRFDNISAGVQNWSTKVIQSWIIHWIKTTGRTDLCLSGGLFMNIKMNGEILNLNGVTSLCVPASGGDESIAAGACFATALKNEEKCKPISHVFLGETASSGQSWNARLSETEMTTDDFSVMDNVGPEEIAKLLEADLILARCVGDAEFGARALGNRSIIANPSNPDNIKTINDLIKNRDFWMPFTPSILAEYANDYLDNPKDCFSPYMSIGFGSKNENREKIIGGLHPGDFSARPQFVKKEDNHDYWCIIDAFRSLTGIPALMNTSLNLHGEPMNYDLADAARTLAKSQLSFLVMPGNELLYKKSKQQILESILDR